MCARPTFQILRGQHRLAAAGSGANLGLRGAVERSLRPPPLLHRHPIEPGVLQEVLLVVRVRPRLHRPIHAADLPVALLPPRATRLRALLFGQQPVDFRWRERGREKRRIEAAASPSKENPSFEAIVVDRRVTFLCNGSSLSVYHLFFAYSRREEGRGKDEGECMVDAGYSSWGREKRRKKKEKKKKEKPRCCILLLLSVRCVRLCFGTRMEFVRSFVVCARRLRILVEAICGAISVNERFQRQAAGFSSRRRRWRGGYVRGIIVSSHPFTTIHRFRDCGSCRNNTVFLNKRVMDL